MDDDALQHETRKRETRKSVLYVQLNGVETWKIAVQEGLSCIFEVWVNLTSVINNYLWTLANVQTLRHYNQSVIAEHFDPDGNTLGHISAKSGNCNLFKVIFTLIIHFYGTHWDITYAQVVFPLQRPLRPYWTRSTDRYSMFSALVLTNNNSDTPLMVAIDNNHYK